MENKEKIKDIKYSYKEKEIKQGSDRFLFF
jgi:hypothetical protein